MRVGQSLAQNKILVLSLEWRDFIKHVKEVIFTEISGCGWDLRLHVLQGFRIRAGNFSERIVEHGFRESVASDNVVFHRLVYERDFSRSQLNWPVGYKARESSHGLGEEGRIQHEAVRLAAELDEPLHAKLCQLHHLKLITDL